MGASKPPTGQKPFGIKRHKQVGKLPSFILNIIHYYKKYLLSPFHKHAFDALGTIMVLLRYWQFDPDHGMIPKKYSWMQFHHRSSDIQYQYVLISDGIEDFLPSEVSCYCHHVILLGIIEDIRFLGIRFGSIKFHGQLQKWQYILPWLMIMLCLFVSWILCNSSPWS